MHAGISQRLVGQLRYKLVWGGEALPSGQFPARTPFPPAGDGDRSPAQGCWYEIHHVGHAWPGSTTMNGPYSPASRAMLPWTISARHIMNTRPFESLQLAVDGMSNPCPGSYSFVSGGFVPPFNG